MPDRQRNGLMDRAVNLELALGGFKLYEGHRIKVKVTGAKKCRNLLFLRRKTIVGNKCGK